MNGQVAPSFIEPKRKLAAWEGFKRKYLELKLKSFSPKITFSFDFKDFEIKTVENASELWEVLRLRYDIFTKSYGVKMKFSEIDFDRLDLLADHIILKCKKRDMIIGTYRMISSEFSSEFYSENEFDISKFKSAPGIKVELGRACIHEDYRNGTSISLVWRGLSRYIVLAGADYLFGCTSVSTTDQSIASRVMSKCQREFQGNKYNIQPTRKYTYPIFDGLKLVADQSEESSDSEIDNYIPSLMRSYLSAGAIVYGHPALDREFSCSDFFTVLDLEAMCPNYYARYIKPWRV